MEPGHVVADRFVVQALVGSGGMGHVYRAVDRASGRDIALKVMNERADDVRFVREARLLREIEHPAIVRYVADGPGYLAMEWLEGEDLAQRLGRGPLSIDETLALGRRLAEGLDAAHARGIVHRDLKPSNVLLEGGRVASAKILDFGIARAASAATRATRTGTAIGTPAYMAPEQARGARDVDARADVFSLGCLLFECLAGRPAFVGEHPIAVLARILLEDPPRLADLVPGVPSGLDALVHAALCKEPEGRPTDAGEVLAAIARIDPSHAAPAPSASITSSEQSFVVVAMIGSDTGEMAATLAADEDSRVKTLVLEIARAHGAACEALASGAVVLLWRGAGAATDLVVRASSCALALRSQIARPIAIAAGQAELEAGRLPIGPALDRAASLVRRTSSIAIDDLAAALVEDRFEVRRRDTLELLGARGTDAVRTLLGRETPCVGRDAELSMLSALYGQACSELEVRCAIVTAPPGAGKSRVRRELLRLLAMDADVLFATANEFDIGSALGLAAQLVRRTAGILDGEPAQDKRAKLEARLAKSVPADRLERVAALIGELIDLDALDPAIASLRAHPGELAEAIRTAFCDFLLAECSARPLVLVLEDLHWGDFASIKLLDTALGVLRDRPVFALALARPEIDERVPELWRDRGVTRIALPPLPRRAAERLVRGVLGDGVDVASIVQRAGGNAFFLEELIRAAAEGRSENLPETIVAMVQVRLQALEADARRLLRAASVFGQVFWEEGLTDIVGASVDVAFWLPRLIDDELVERRRESTLAGRHELAFRHAFVREAAYAMLSEADLKLGHRLAAQWLERMGADDPLVLAAHFERGELPDPAARALLRAARAAIRAQDLPSAILHARRASDVALDAEIRVDALQLQSHALSWRGMVEEAERTANDALTNLDPAHPAWPLFASWRLFALTLRGDTEGAALMAGRLLEHDFNNPVSRHESIGLFIAPWALFYAGRRDLAEALMTHTASVRAMSPEDAPFLAAWRLAIEAHLMLFRDADPWATYVASERAFAVLREDGADPHAVSSLQQALGAFLLALGDFEQGERMIQEAVAVAECSGGSWSLMWARVSASLAPSRRTELTQTLELQRACVRDSAGMGAVLMEGIARTGMAGTLALMGDLDDAASESALAIDQLAPFPPMRAVAFSVRANVLLHAGDPEEALACAQRGCAEIERGGTWIVPDYAIRLAEAEALRALGRAEEAKASIARTRERLLDRAECIPDPATRERFLKRIRVHAKILELASVLEG